MDVRGLIERFGAVIDLGTGIALAVVAVYVAVVIGTTLSRRLGTPRFLTAPRQAAPPRVLAWALSRRRLVFVVKACAFALLVWCLGLALAPVRGAFLSSREWQVQPVYLAVHLITLRLFTGIFALNYLEGTAYLAIEPDAARSSVRRALIWRGGGFAVLAALPFCALDLRYFLSPAYAKLSGTMQPLAVDWVMYGIWSLEWLINAMIWVTLLSFVFMNVVALRRSAFRAPIHIVLLEKQYRPFLRMSVQGASIVLLFGIMTAGYIAYAGGEWSDYLGLIITTVLLAVCFVPPWFALKYRVHKAVMQDMTALRGVLMDAAQVGQNSELSGLANPVATLSDLDRRQREQLALLRMLHLDRLHQDVGRREATAVAVRLLPPALTIGWHVWVTGSLAKLLLSVRGLVG